MPVITFNAFAFLQKELKARNIPCAEAAMDIPPETTPNDVLSMVGLERDDVEAIFVNGRVSPFDTPLADGDRLALIPPGMPGPYRVLLGFKSKKNR